MRRLALVALAAAAFSGDAGAVDYIASTGEAVDVVVPAGQERRGQEIADLVASFPHGSELADVTITLLDVPHAKVQCLGAVACYSPFYETIVMPEESADYPWEQVLAHEYGHHLAANRLNPPWEASFWGPKHWATAAKVCPSGDNVFGSYDTHPAEAFAEAYRLYVATLKTAWTPFQTFISSATFPMGPDVLAAVERDVSRPWSWPSSRTWKRQLRAGQSATVTVRTPLDGELELALTGPGRVTVDGRSGTSVRRTVCGRRAWTVRVQARKSGIFRLSITAP